MTDAFFVSMNCWVLYKTLWGEHFVQTFESHQGSWSFVEQYYYAYRQAKHCKNMSLPILLDAATIIKL